ncbi:MAG: D-alanine transaminase [Polaribacter sp.]|jgi:D-alanine transaminase
MSIAYLNGEFMPIEDAKISPLDRGFLFGDSIYEFIPYYKCCPVGFDLHIQRMLDGLSKIQIKIESTDWRGILDQIIAKNDGDELAVYIQVSRGADVKRAHQFPTNIKPTIFIMTQPIAKQVLANAETAKTYSVLTSLDQRWKHCDIKSTSLLGNVLHFQKGYENNKDETLLFNNDGNLTECSACNVFVVNGDKIATPILDKQILPGVTRRLVINAVNSSDEYSIEERNVSLEEAKLADEIWITSSSKQIAPVIEMDGIAVGNGKVGIVWEECSKLFDKIKYL